MGKRLPSVHRVRRGFPLALLACLSTVLGTWSPVPATATRRASADRTTTASPATIYLPLVRNQEPAPPLAYTNAGEIFVMNPDGSATTNLTNTPNKSEFTLQWSPTARKLAYLSPATDPANTGGIYLMNADGSGKVKLCEVCDTAAWSPDGSRLAVVQSHGGVTSLPAISVLANDGSATTKLCDACTSPAWSPDGARLAFEGDCVYLFKGGVFCDALYASKADGSAKTKLSDLDATWAGMARPAWSPDGTRVAFVNADASSSSHDVNVVTADGTGTVNLTNTTDEEESVPQWSPDGGLLAFLQNSSAADTDIYVMSADGSTKINLTNTPEIHEYQAQWSPTGNQLVFVQFVRTSETTTPGEICVMNADGSGRTNLTNTPTVEEQLPVWLSHAPR